MPLLLTPIAPPPGSRSTCSGLAVVDGFGMPARFVALLGGLLWLLCSSPVVNADFSVTPFISAGVSYTDNVDLVAVDEEYEIITLVAPGVDLSYTWREHGLGLTYVPTYASYTRFPENDNWRHSVILDGWAEIARNTRLEVSNAFLQTEDPISETDSTVRRGREPYITNTATVGMVNRFGAEDTIDLRYVYYFLENDDPTIEDNAYHRPSLAMTYWFAPNRYAVEMEGAYTLSRYDVSEDFEELEGRFRLVKRFSRQFDGYIEYNHLSLDYLEDGEDYQVYSPLVGFTWSERADTRFGASFGYFYRDNDISESDDGLVGSVSLDYDWSADSSIGFAGSAGYEIDSFGAEALGFNRFYDVGATLTHQLGRQLAGTLSVGHRRVIYPDEGPDREDAVWRAGAGLAYQALPWMTVNLDYLYRQLRSNIDINDYTENRGTISVTLTPRQAIRF